MPIFRMRGLGTKGVIQDMPPFDLSSGSWSNASNVRFSGGRVSKMGGNEIVLERTMPSGIVPLGITQRSNIEELIYGTKTSLYNISGGLHTNISALKVGSDGVPLVPNVLETYEASPENTWYYTTLSNSMVFTNELNDPQGLKPLDVNFSTLPGWGRDNKHTGYDSSGKPVYNYQKKAWKTPRIRAFKDYLLAMGMTESGVEYPQRVRWSDVSYVNNLPSNWHQNDPNTDGGFNDLSNSIGKIVDGVPLRDSFVVYTDMDTFLMDYVGGDYIFNFRKLFSDSGLLAPECAVEFEGQHFVVSESDIFVHNGSTRKSIVSGRMKSTLINEISAYNPSATKVFAFEPKKEIWITYVSTGESSSSAISWACNKAAIWNWEYDTWTFYELPNIHDICIGLPQTIDTRRWDQYEGVEATPTVDSVIPTGTQDVWDGISHELEQWQVLGKTFRKQLLYTASSFSQFYTLDSGSFYNYKDLLGVKQVRPLVAFIERTSIDLDEQEGEINRHKFVQEIYPQFTGKGIVRFYTGGSNDPESYPTWDDNQLFEIGEDSKVDCFTNYRYPAIKVVDTGVGEWGFTGMDIKYIMEGTR